MGKVMHFEIPADNVAKAEEFYRKAFGWNMSAVPGMEYRMVLTGPTDEQGMAKEPGFINGGMFKRNEKVRNPVITIVVDDIDDVVKKIENAGGKIVQPATPVGDMGISAYFRDTEGNILGLWKSVRAQESKDKEA